MSPLPIVQGIASVAEGRNLLPAQVEAIFDDIFDHRATPAQIGALLVGLRMKGETADELTGAATVMRRRAVKVTAPAGRVVLDTCGTGGDVAGTFNISTAVAFVASAAGATVAKHVHESLSRAGSAEVLGALGIRIDLPVSQVERCLDEIGLAFLHASQFHLAVRELAGLRREVGVRSVFDLLSPLTNPAGATRQLVGVFQSSLVEIVAHTLAALGTERSLVVFGEEGLDEISPCGPTRAAFVDGGKIWPMILMPEDLDIPRIRVEDLRGGNADTNAEALRAVLSGSLGPLRSAVVLNAAAAIWIAGLAPDLRAGATLAREQLDSGAALHKLDALVTATK